MTTIKLRKYPKACERLGLLHGDDDLIDEKTGNWIWLVSPFADRVIAGAALLWLAERKAWVYPWRSKWEVGCDEPVKLPCPQHTPLEAMLAAIEGWEE